MQNEFCIHSLYSDTELYHHGIMGMKWGVRRYQNPDGSYTDAGRKRYGIGESRGYRKPLKNGNNNYVTVVDTKSKNVPGGSLRVNIKANDNSAADSSASAINSKINRIIKNGIKAISRDKNTDRKNVIVYEVDYNPKSSAKEVTVYGYDKSKLSKEQINDIMTDGYSKGVEPIVANVQYREQGRTAKQVKRLLNDTDKYIAYNKSLIKRMNPNIEGENRILKQAIKDLKNAENEQEKFLDFAKKHYNIKLKDIRRNTKTKAERKQTALGTLFGGENGTNTVGAVMAARPGTFTYGTKYKVKKLKNGKAPVFKDKRTYVQNM